MQRDEVNPLRDDSKIKLLEKDTLVLVNKDGIFESQDKGVSYLLSLAKQHKTLADTISYDKIVGKAAALLYLYLGVKAVYAKVISSEAERLFQTHHLPYAYETKVPAILNPSKTQRGPFEKALVGIDDPKEALPILSAVDRRFFSK
jgi:pullulanase/glycogen debranching enzyme